MIRLFPPLSIPFCGGDCTLADFYFRLLGITHDTISKIPSEFVWARYLRNYSVALLIAGTHKPYRGSPYLLSRTIVIFFCDIHNILDIFGADFNRDSFRSQCDQNLLQWGQASVLSVQIAVVLNYLRYAMRISRKDLLWSSRY